MKQSYKDTLNLPKTDFPMKASLATRELQRIEKWQQQGIYYKMQERNVHNPHFIVHDGPPYANGHLHVGHSMNKILKDIIAKYKSKRGFYSPYIPGWDCHGLPIEIQAQKKLKSPYSKNQLRDACKAHAESFIEIQKEEFQRIMVFGDYENRYATLDYSYEAEILGVLKTAITKDLVYRGNRPVHWCISCATALADAEIEYAMVESPSLFLAFPVKQDSNLSFLVWTTTPWTLIANVGLAIHQDIKYGVYTDEGRDYILAKELAISVNEKTGHQLALKRDISVDEILALTAKHPFLERDSKLILGDHVTLDAGTGIVHTAPSHGEEDFQVGLKNNLPLIMAINDYGKFIETPMVKGIDFILGDTIWKANPKIIEKLGEVGHLFSSTVFKHSYPHCWRCKNPVVVRTTQQWFIAVSSLVPIMVDQIKKYISYIPADRKERMLQIVQGRPDWCISRQRAWGVPIPSIKCICGNEFLDTQIVNTVQERIAKEGANFWFDLQILTHTIIPELENRVCPECNKKGEYTRGQDILDVWFDSAVSWKDLLQNKLKLPLDTDISLYSEGNDQFRAWYQVSLITSIIERGKSPYQQILTHGMVLDEKGKAMSKSIGNVMSPIEISNQYGADILRLWVVSQTYSEDTRIGKNILDQVSDMYRKIRNTFRFMLSNLYDYTYTDFLAMDKNNLQELDQWALYKVEDLQKKVYMAYNNYSFDTVLKEIFIFMNEDLSSFYLDILKDPMYTLKPDSDIRRSSQYAMICITQVLADLLAPILNFTSEEVYEYLPFTTIEKQESIFLSDGLVLDNQEQFVNSYQKIEKILALRLKVLKQLELLRQEKVIGSNLEAKVIIKTSDRELLALDNLDFYFIVSEYELQESDQELEIFVTKGSMYKCPRCYRYVSSTEDELCERCKEVLK